MKALPIATFHPRHSVSFCLVAGVAMTLLAGCATNENVKNLEALRRVYGPEAPDGIQDTVATPPHSMSRSDYPFDSRGNYREEWVTAAASSSSRPTFSGETDFDRSSTSRRGSFHVVKKGDTLYGISRRYDVPLYNLRKANNLRSHTIYPGQRLRIPPQ